MGEIVISIDGNEITYSAEQGAPLKALCPDILGRYQVEVMFDPDGKNHEIACTINAEKPIRGYVESGERLECQGFYSEDRYKLSIGVECDAGYFPAGKRISNEYDYDAEYLENGVAYIISPTTKTRKYIFGIAWIDDVGENDEIDPANDRDTQTWFGADPTLGLN